MLVRSAEDVLDALSMLPNRRFYAPATPAFETEANLDAPLADQVQRIRDALAHNPSSIDDIARAADIGAARCSAILMELELAGEASTLRGGLAVLAVSHLNVGSARKSAAKVSRAGRVGW